MFDLSTMSESKSTDDTGGGIVEAFERFFLDIIGTILPGLALLVGYCYITQKSIGDISEILFGHKADYDWIIILALAYILGHAITSLGYKIIKQLERAYESPTLREALIGEDEVPSTDAGAKTKTKREPDWMLSFVVPQKKMEAELASDPIYNAFLETISKKIPALKENATSATKPRVWRNMAMSIAPEQSQLVYRFMFIALFNLGVSTVCICLFVFWTARLVSNAAGASMSVPAFNPLLIALGIAPYFFLERFYNFGNRAFKLPFSMALAKLAQQQPSKQAVSPTAPQPNISIAPGRLRIYLAGGFKSGWQNRLIMALPSFDYFDPRAHGLAMKKEYTAWDLEAIRRCDCVFAYFESQNPGGYALALEVGFAKALGKFVIFVDEKSPSDTQAGRYLEMVAETVDVHFNTFQEGIDFLGKYKLLQ
jgi:hypothetical protein